MPGRILSSSILQRACFKGEKLPMGSDYSTVRKRTSDKDSGDSAESIFCRDEKLPSGSDDPTW